MECDDAWFDLIDCLDSKTQFVTVRVNTPTRERRVSQEEFWNAAFLTFEAAMSGYWA